MNKSLTLVIVALSILVVGGGVFAYNNNQSNKKEAEKMAMEKKTDEEAMDKEDAMAKEDSMEGNDAMSKHGSYVSLDDYNANSSKYADSKKVYFFHASWCPICQSIDKDINSDMTKIPEGVTIIKTDYDNSTELRQKYGVTTQYTFVQVDDDGNETAQWSATSLDKALDGISS